MANPRKKAAENISRREPESGDRYLGKGPLAHSRPLHYDDLTNSAYAGYRDSTGYLRQDLENRFEGIDKHFQSPRDREIHNSIELYLLDRLRRSGVKPKMPGGLAAMKRSGKWIPALIKAGLVKPGLMPEESARQRAARKLAMSKRQTKEARLRPLGTVASGSRPSR